MKVLVILVLLLAFVFGQAKAAEPYPPPDVYDPYPAPDRIEHGPRLTDFREYISHIYQLILEILYGVITIPWILRIVFD